MTEISLHILDIAQNSVKAKAKNIGIDIFEDIDNDVFKVVISDDGSGMDEVFLKNVTDPFKTTRTTRKVGMGLSLFKTAAEITGGKFLIESKLGVGTVVTAEFVYSSIDRQPLGDMASTITTLIGSDESIDYKYTHTYNGNEFTFDTVMIREVMQGVSLTTPEVLLWIEEYINEGLKNITEV